MLGNRGEQNEARTEAPSKQINASGFQDFPSLLPIFPPKLNPEGQVKVQQGESIDKGQFRSSRLDLFFNVL